jgi:hypothetical protein
MGLQEGTRLEVVEDREVTGLTAWRAPATGDFKCTLTAGTILVVTMDQAEGAPGFPCKPERYEQMEPVLVPARDRRQAKYGGYWFVLMEEDVGTWFRVMSSA